MAVLAPTHSRGLLQSPEFEPLDRTSPRMMAARYPAPKSEGLPYSVHESSRYNSSVDSPSTVRNIRQSYTVPEPPEATASFQEVQNFMRNISQSRMPPGTSGYNSPPLPATPTVDISSARPESVRSGSTSSSSTVMATYFFRETRVGKPVTIDLSGSGNMFLSSLQQRTRAITRGQQELDPSVHSIEIVPLNVGEEAETHLMSLLNVEEEWDSAVEFIVDNRRATDRKTEFRLILLQDI